MKIFLVGFERAREHRINPIAGKRTSGYSIYKFTFIGRLTIFHHGNPYHLPLCVGNMLTDKARGEVLCCYFGTQPRSFSGMPKVAAKDSGSVHINSHIAPDYIPKSGSIERDNEFFHPINFCDIQRKLSIGIACEQLKLIGSI